MRQKLEARLHEILEKVVDNQLLPEIVDRIVVAVNAETDENKVLEFHQTFNQPIGEKPGFPNEQLIMNRLKWELEEMSEFAKACGHPVYGGWQRLLFKESQDVHKDAEKNREKLVPNLKEAFDGWLDSKYFLAGRGIVMGFLKIGPNGFADVHDSNMTKACTSIEETELTRRKYADEGIEIYSQTKTINGMQVWPVFRKGDHKVLKSINYQPVELAKYVEDELQDNNQSDTGTSSGS